MGVVASAHGRIEVDPDVLINAGKRIESLGSQLGVLCDCLGTALASGLASGNDAAGLSFALEYGRAAEKFAETLAKAANAYKAVGRMLQATGYNYKNADAGSTIGGHGAADGLGPAPSDTVAGDMPAGPNGVMVPPPTMWYLIEPLLSALPGLGLIAGAAMSWPSGHPALMNVVAAQWRNFATGFAVFQNEVTGLKPAVAAQNIPEGGKIGEAFQDLGERMTDLATASKGLADAINNFAREVQQTQDAIRRLLDRLSLSGLWDTVTDFFTGDAMKVLREVARDVGTVLSNFQRQIKGIVGLLGELKNLISDAADAFEKWVRPVLVAQFGDDVGNFLADAVTLYTDFEVGIANGLINTVSGVVSMADPNMWKGLAETAWAVANDPSKAPGVLAEMGKQFIALDQWKGDHPGRGAGEAAFNIGSLFVPGGALSKTGSVAKSLNMTRRVIEEGRLPKLGELGQRSRGAPALDGLGDVPGGRGLPDVPEVRPGAIPDSLIGPTAPYGIDAPATPHGLEGPSGPPDPPGPQSTPGAPHQGTGPGDGPPPEPPGRSVPPTDPGPSHVDGPSPEPSGSPHEPQSPTPPAPMHAPESPAPAGTSETQRTPESSPHVPHEGPRPDEHQAGPRLGENPSPAGLDAPVASPAPTEHQPAVHEPSAHEPVDSSPPHTPNGRDVGQHSAPPAPMVGGMSMAPHAAGGMHGPGDAPSRTPTAETPARNPETRTPQGNTPEGPRTQSPSGAGPAVERSPQAPVKPVAQEPTARPGLEAHVPRAGDSSRPSENHQNARSNEDHDPDPAHTPHEQTEHDNDHSNDDGSLDGGAADRYVELEDGSQHRIWASNEQLRAQDSRFAAADSWLAERGLTRADIQPLLVQPADWLNNAQRELVYGFRHQFPDVEHGEALQKVVDGGQAESRLAGGSLRFPPNETGGSVSVARDTRGLNTPENIYDGLALEYPNTPFAPDKPAVAMRFTVDEGVQVHLPDGQLSKLLGQGDSFDPGYGYPFTGTGFTASDHLTVPEYFLDGNTAMNPGAEMYRINVDGTEELVAVLGENKRWIRVVQNE